MRGGTLAAVMAAAAVLLAGCAAGGTVAGTPLAEGGAVTPPAASPPPAPGALTLATTEAGELGTIITDGSGMTLYRFDKDTAKPPTSVCDGECASAWPPALLKGGGDAPQVGGIDPALVGTLARPDGSTQLTIAGWPAYYYVKDVEPGHTRGQGANGTWFAFTADGKKAAGAGSGAPVLTEMRIDGLGSVLTDRAGMTLYRFDSDKRGEASTCVGRCAETWTPLTVDRAAAAADGIPAEVGTVARDDGALQVTVNGWPLYRYSGDSVPCDAKGQGVDGAWFAVTPQGDKVE